MKKKLIRLAGLAMAGLVALCSLNVCAQGLKFAQITDPHVFEKLKSRAQEDSNWKAFRWSIASINAMDQELKDKEGSGFRFVVLTGDLGLEELDTLNQPTLKEGAEMVAKELFHSSNTDWLIVPGNNDLTNEHPADIDHYHKFVTEVNTELLRLKSNVQLIDLCWAGDPSGSPDAKNVEARDYKITVTNTPTNTSRTYHFIGFDSASFKSDNTKGEEYYTKHMERLAAVSKTLSAVKAPDYAYIFHHIPEIDDPYVVSKAPSSVLNERYQNKMKISDSYFYSAWIVSNKVREAWSNILTSDVLKGVVAGHFHSNEREKYEDLKSWMVTVENKSKKQTYYSVVSNKLFVGPPLALKNQADDEKTARGFRWYRIKDADGSLYARTVWYEPEAKDGKGGTVICPGPTYLPYPSSTGPLVVVQAGAAPSSDCHCDDDKKHGGIVPDNICDKVVAMFEQLFGISKDIKERLEKSPPTKASTAEMVVVIFILAGVVVLGVQVKKLADKQTQNAKSLSAVYDAVMRVVLVGQKEERSVKIDKDQLEVLEFRLKRSLEEMLERNRQEESARLEATIKELGRGVKELSEDIKRFKKPSAGGSQPSPDDIF